MAKGDKCIAPNCNKIIKTQGKECSTHRYRRWKYGDYSYINPRWNNLKKGTPTISISYKYFRININGKRVLLHRHIMEQFLGRKLDPKEKVHHKNGIKTDNRIENLIIVYQSDHMSKYHRKKILVDWTTIIVPSKANRWHPKIYQNCLVPNCAEKPKYRGLCNKHFISWRRHGN